MANFNIAKEYNEAFEKAYSTLNKAQQDAVNQVEGAILVVAGPGTGKTQLLAARIGYILQQTDTQAGNILALTFTDAGAVAMRKRLLDFIGPEAYNVSIYTFHAFCTKVIQENIEYFGGYYDLQALSELEQVEVVRQIIREFPDDHILKRFKGNLYYERQPLVQLFATVKKEGWDIEHIKSIARAKIEAAENNPDLLYKRKSGNNLKGDKNRGKITAAQKPFEKLIAGIGEFQKYEDLLAKRERFDFNDMILWVIEKFQQNEDLLLRYQEKYQFILVDEYQDTNGSQNELVSLLASFWEDPNLFVVGDDDQSIYRFQGANMSNIVEFVKKYSPNIVVLENNYRSSQLILNQATKLIDNNPDRLVNTFDEKLTKNLLESREERSIQVEPKIRKYPNHTQEEIGIAQEIIDLHEQGEKLSEVAVIYRKHSNVENIVKYLELKDIPLNIKRRLNVLETVEIERICNILSYIHKEGIVIDSANDLLFEILHYQCFGLRPRDIGKVAVYCSRRTDKTEDDRNWDTVLTSLEMLTEIKVSNPEKLMTTYEILQGWIASSKNMTLQVLFEKILTEGKIIDSVMNSSDRVWRLQLINTFFDFIKDESVKKPDLSLGELLHFIELMKENNIRLPYEKIVSNVDGVNFMTAHGAKGLEFDRVYIIRCESKNWDEEGSGRNSFKIPKGLFKDDTDAEAKMVEQEQRRLFYVAMTRAKNYLMMSYAEANDKDKPLEPSRFLTELTPPGQYVVKEIDNEKVLEYTADLMRYSEAPIELIDENLVNRVLENFSLSVTNLTKFLKCPLRFYFESILRVPLARNQYMGFGKAMHYALEQLFIAIEEDPERTVPSVEDLIGFFSKGMDRTRSHYTSEEYKNLVTHGKGTLEDYYQSYSAEWSKPNHYKVEYKVDLTEHRGVPIKGVLDRVDVFQNHLEVVDYKTGKYVAAKLKPPLGDEDFGGDYWRQLVFYQILLNADSNMTKPMRKGFMDFLEVKEGAKRNKKEVEVSELEVEMVGDQLVAVYAKIKNKEFTPGCNEDDCKWCNFVNNNFALETTLEDFADDDR